MFVITKDGYELICDGPTCTARTDAARAHVSGWTVPTWLGPHLCPADVAIRFTRLMTQTFSDPLP